MWEKMLKRITYEQRRLANVLTSRQWPYYSQLKKMWKFSDGFEVNINRKIRELVVISVRFLKISLN